MTAASSGPPNSEMSAPAANNRSPPVTTTAPGGSALSSPAACSISASSAWDERVDLSVGEGEQCDAVVAAFQCEQFVAGHVGSLADRFPSTRFSTKHVFVSVAKSVRMCYTPHMATGRCDSPIDAVDLDGEFNVVAGHLNAQHARLVDLTVQLLADPGPWISEGIHTPELFLAWRVGLSPQRARQVVAIARRSTELPACVEAFRNGELAIDQMAAIARRAPWWTDSEVCELGKLTSVSQLTRALGKYPFPEIPNPDAPAADDPGIDESTADNSTHDTPDGTPTPTGAAAPADRSWFGVGDDGRFRLQIETDELTGMTIEAALREARDALFQGGQHDVDWVDAFREISERSLDSVGDAARRDRYRIHVNLRTDGAATDSLGHTLPDAIRQYITCDGLLSPRFIDGSIPISVGRTQRMIPQRTRLVVLQHDQGCRIPGCTADDHLEIHHIVHWEDGGPTDTWNLVALCRASPPPAPSGRTRDHRQRRHARRPVDHQPARPSGRRQRRQTRAPWGTTAVPDGDLPSPSR